MSTLLLQKSSQGLVFVYVEAGPHVSEADLNGVFCTGFQVRQHIEEFTDWYDNEHAPLRLTVPGFVCLQSLFL
jgi:hypothetical protein